jgi:hypothetical protein
VLSTALRWMAAPPIPADQRGRMATTSATP